MLFGARFLTAVLRVTTGGEEGRESPHRHIEMQLSVEESNIKSTKND